MECTLVPGRRRLALALVVLATPLLSACAAGFDATSLKPYSPADGVYAENEAVRALNVLLVVDEDGSTGLLSMTLANRSGTDDEVTGVETDGGTASLAAPVDLPAGATTTFGGEDADAQVLVEQVSTEPGRVVEVRLTFSSAPPLSVRTVVVAAEGDYAEVTPSAEPSLTP